MCYKCGNISTGYFHSEKCFCKKQKKTKKKGITVKLFLILHFRKMPSIDKFHSPFL